MTILSKKKASQVKTESETQNSASNSSNFSEVHSHDPTSETIPNNSDGSKSHSHEMLPDIGQNAGKYRSSTSKKDESSMSPPQKQDLDQLEVGPSPVKKRMCVSPNRSPSFESVMSLNSKDDLVDCESHEWSGNSSIIVSASKTRSPDDVNDYNSGDEYDNSSSENTMPPKRWNDRDKWFEDKLSKQGFIIKKMTEDGACLFRAVADQVYGDQDMHSVVRKHCMDYLAANADYFAQYVTEDFSSYVERKRLNNVHGNNVEIQGISEIFNRNVEIYSYSVKPINIFHSAQKTDNEPIRLSYHRGSHYNSIVHPFRATIGVGLGLPGFEPGLADKTQMKEAVRQSETLQIEQAMLEDKLRATDWEATNEVIEEQIARESYLQWLRDNEKRNKVDCRPGSPASSTSTSATNEEKPSQQRIRGSESPPSVARSPKRKPSSSGITTEELEKESRQKLLANPSRPTSPQAHSSLNINGEEEVFGVSDWSDAEMLSKVLAMSQQEYLDSLKKQNSEPRPPSPR